MALKCHKVRAHPAHLDLLAKMMNAGEAKDIAAVKVACEVIDELEATLDVANEGKGGSDSPLWLDPCVVTEKAWARVNKDDPKALPPGAIYEPLASFEVTLSPEQYKSLKETFEKVLPSVRPEFAGMRTKRALGEAIENASKAVEVDLA